MASSAPLPNREFNNNTSTDGYNLEFGTTVVSWLPAAPTLSSLSVSSDYTVGGMSVTISGANFTNASAVNFGGTAAASFTVNSASSITAIAPAESVGTVDVTVTTVGGTSATSSADHFTYNAVPAPAVTRIAPASGPLAGGTLVDIIGSGFTSASTVSFGGTAATAVTVVSSTLIQATAPAGSGGNVDITVTAVGGTSSTSSADRFTYTTAAVATPSNAPITASTVTLLLSDGSTRVLTGYYDSKYGGYFNWSATGYILSPGILHWVLNGVNNTSTDGHNLEFGTIVASW